MSSITDFTINCSPSVRIGILAGLHWSVYEIIDDFVKTGKVDSDYNPNDQRYPLKRAMNVFLFLKDGERKALSHVEYHYLMSYRELLYFENPPVKTNEDKIFLELLKDYTTLLIQARHNVFIKGL